MNVRRIAFAAVSLVFFAAPAGAQQTPAGQPLVVQEDRPGLLAQATVRPEVAFQTARAQVPGGELREAEIETKRNRLVYSFEFAVQGQRGQREVNVDARTGEVVSTKHEANDDDEDSDEDTDSSDQNRRPRPPGR
jgi:Peptidase propeptide and YPEB domain